MVCSLAIHVHTALIYYVEAALSQLESIQARLQQNELDLQKEIASLREELRREQSPQRMQTIQEMIGVGPNIACREVCSHKRKELLSQMVRIREKATESEAIVKNITRDIQSLDLAKKNLSQSMTALKRFQMLGEFDTKAKKTERYSAF